MIEGPDKIKIVFKIIIISALIASVIMWMIVPKGPFHHPFSRIKIVKSALNKSGDHSTSGYNMYNLRVRPQLHLQGLFYSQLRHPIE